MPRVQVQGVGVVQFPDDMTPDQITAAIEKDILPRAAMKSKGPTADDIRAQQAEGTSIGQAALIGAGKVADKLFSGAKQAFLGGWLPESMQGDYTKAELAKLKAEQESNAAEYRPLQEAHPVATTVGEIAATLPFGVAGNGYRAAMAAGAAPALLEYGDASEKGLGALAGVVGGALGQAAGNLIGKVLRRGPAVELAAAERAALVDAARVRGYELRPDQITGKNWQRNLAAALQENPASSGVMERHAAKQTANTQRLVEDTLDRAGGSIDQASAAAAAHEGMAAGLNLEAGVIDKAYRDLLAGREVDLEALRPALAQILDKQKALPEHLQGSPAVAGLREMLGDPGYSAKAVRQFQRPGLDPAKDDIIVAIRKLGGINPDDEAVGSLAKANPFPNDPRLGPVWRRQQFGGASNRTNTIAGHGLDEMAQKLRAQGYPVNGPDDVMDAIANAGMGKATYSEAFDYAAQQAAEDPLTAAINRLDATLGANRAPPAPRGGFIRDNPKVDGELAQDLRSGYSAKSEAAFAHGKNAEGDAFRQMREAVDGVIRKSLPEAEKEQFAAINQRYGLGVALKMLPKRDQHALLQDIYRGFKSEDEFAAFIAMSPDAEFQKVARGFLSDLVGKATDKAGNVSAARLGRVTRAADKDAMSLLGGDNAAELATIGRIGEGLLPELGNSQTANRAMWLRALQNPLTLAGAGAGGAFGGGEGGTPGALAGAAAGAFLAPQVAARLYLSDLARRGLARAPSQYGGVPGLRDAMTPEVEAYLAQLLRGLTASGALSAVD